MMGRTHMAVGTAIYCTYDLPSTTDEVPVWIAGVAIVNLAALLPDVDEPRSKIGGLIMSFVPSYARLAAFVLLGAYLCYQGWILSQWLLSIIGAVLLFLSLVKHRESPTHGFVGMIGFGALVYSHIPELLLPYIIGYGSHLLLDVITEGIPLFYPIKKRIRIPITTTNSVVERFVIYPLSFIWIAWIVIQNYNLIT